MDSAKTLSLPPLKALQAFEQTARFANVARAAEQLALTPSAVSHQLAKLEALVGRALFVRGARGMTLTPAGEQYLEEVSEVLHRLAMATDRAASDAGLECLRLHSAPSFGLLWLMPRLEQFRQSHPDLQINLSCSYESLHFSRDKVNIDIRHGLPSWPNLEIRTLQRERLAVLAAPQLLEKRPIHSPADLLHSELILSEATLMKWPNWFAQQGLALPERPYTLESTVLAADYLARGDLVRVLTQDDDLPVAAHHLVFPRAHSRYARVRRFLDWLQQELGQPFEY